MMASVLLAAATAGVLLPIVAAASAQTDAQRRVIATRLAADVIESIAAMEYETVSCPDNYIKTAADLDYVGPAYQYLSVRIKTENVDVNGTPLILLTVEAFDNNKPMTTLKTLVGSR